MVISKQLQGASTVMAWLSLSGAAVLAVAVPLAFLVPNPTIALGPAAKLGFVVDDVTAAIPFVYRAEALAITMVPIGLLLFALVTLFRLFRCYASGKVFEGTSLSHLRHISTAMFLLVPAHVLAESGTQYVLHLPLRQSWISFKIDTPMFGLLFLAGVALVISRVMAEAQRVADENAKFV